MGSKSRRLCSFSEKEGSNYEESSDAECVPSLEYRNSLRRVAARLASIFFLQSDIIQFPYERSDIFYGESSPSPDRADDRLSQFRLSRLSSSLTALARTHRSKNNLVTSPGNAADDVHFQNRLRDDQRSDKSRPRSLAEPCSTPLTAAPQTRVQVPKIGQFASLGQSLPNYPSCFVTRKVKSTSTVTPVTSYVTT